MNFQEILAVLKDKTTISSFGYEDYDSKEMGLGECEEVEKYGGEGKGETWYSVKHFKDHDIYIRVDAVYYSHDGVNFDDWSDCKEVRPREKMITVFE